MNYDDYAKYVASINFTQNADAGWDRIHHCMSLCSEAGELASKVTKREFRGYRHMKYMTDAMRTELGDVVYHVVALCNNLGISLPELWAENAEKLRRREKEGTLAGEGDER